MININCGGPIDGNPPPGPPGPPPTPPPPPKPVNPYENKQIPQQPDNAPKWTADGGLDFYARSLH